MDYLSMIKPVEWNAFAQNFNYKKNGFKGQALFPAQKHANLKLALRNIIENGDLPVMAQVHALDAETRIGDRPNFKELVLEKLLIKEKINQTERIAMYLDNGGREDGLVREIFNDASNMLSRVITRTEVANMELLSDGRITINENNVNTVVDYGFNEEKNKVVLSNWSDPDHDIISDLREIRKKAKALGFDVVRAITSSKVVGYLFDNTAIKGFWEKKSDPMSEGALLSWINANFGLEIVVNDDTYKLSALSSEQKRFFDENTITFLSTRGTLGAGLFGVTPEELMLSSSDGIKVSADALCTITQWEDADSAAIWTKASGMYLPAPFAINKMIIAKLV